MRVTWTVPDGDCACVPEFDWSDVRHIDYVITTAEKDLLDIAVALQYGGGADIVNLMDGKSSGVIGPAAAALLIKVQEHAQGGSAKGLKVQRFLSGFVTVAEAVPTATWIVTE